MLLQFYFTFESKFFNMKPLLIFLAALLFIQAFFVEAESVSVATKPLSQEDGGHSVIARTINCSHECSRRCSKASRKKICLRACKSCCAKCHCVPPGTYGNTDRCPCYARLRTHRNKLKCP